MKKSLITMMLCCLPLLAWAQNITFADANVKAICVANWDTNRDGELSKAEAAAVNDLGTVFYGKINIKEFTELQFFTGLTSIGYNAFGGCYDLMSITIPEGVTSIEAWAFEWCTGLTSITIPAGVTSIGGDAFMACGALVNIVVDENNTVYTSANGANAIIEKASNNLILGCKNTIIPESVTSIGDHAFWGRSAPTNFTIPRGVTKIGELAFQGSGLTSIIIPKGITSIGIQAFSDCPDLTSIVVDEGNSVYTSANGANAIIEKASNTLIAGCKSTIIPAGVTSIGQGAFYACSGLTSITIPEGVTGIGHWAFADCHDLKSVTIPNSVTSIGWYAFCNCI